MSEKAPFMVFSGTNSRYLAEKICASLNCPLGKMNITHFADGEFAVSYEESIRGANVFLVQSTFPNSDNLMELLLMVDAAKRASAKSVIAVIPYFGWARQDRKDKPRVSIGAKLVADLLSVAGIDRLITMDLHADQIQGFFNIPVDHLLGAPVLSNYLKDRIGDNVDEYVAVSPDLGSVTRARTFATRLGCPLAIVDKRRQKANVSEVMNIIGDVRGKKVILIDDMVDTAGTLCNSAQALIDKGGATEVIACATHGVLSGPAIERLQNSCIKELILLDTIPLPPEKAIPKITLLPVAPLFAEAIERIYEDKPVSTMYTF